MRYGRWAMPLLLALATGPASAQEQPTELEIALKRVDQQGVWDTIGIVTARQTDFGGVLFTPDLRELPPGLHGFHVHENPSCEPAPDDSGRMTAAESAGGHFDPKQTGHHAGPFGDGHLGDLPALYVDEQGRATQAIHAPRLALSDLEGRALVIHAGGDNYADEPEPLGGGGERIACGVVGEE